MFSSTFSFLLRKVCIQEALTSCRQFAYSCCEKSENEENALSSRTRSRSFLAGSIYSYYILYFLVYSIFGGLSQTAVYSDFCLRLYLTPLANTPHRTDINFLIIIGFLYSVDQPFHGQCVAKRSQNTQPFCDSDLGT